MVRYDTPRSRVETPRTNNVRSRVDEDLVRDGTVLRILLTGIIFCGVALMSLSIYSNTFDKTFVNFAATFLRSLNEGYEAAFSFFLFGPLIAGVFSIVLALLAMFSSSLDRQGSETLDEMLDQMTCKTSHRFCHRHCGSTARGSFRIIIVFLIIVFVLQIVFGGLYLYFLKTMLQSIENVADSTGTTTGLQAQVSSLQIAMYNLCCDSQGWSAQDTIPPCDSDDQSPKDSCGLTGNAADYADVLCICYPLQDHYNSYFDSLEMSGEICKTLSNAIVDISSTQKIPSTSIPLHVFVKTQRARIVGYNGAPSQDNTTAADPKGYGCGFGGYAVAFQYQQFLYINQSSKYIAVAVVILSICELIVIVGIVCQQVSSNDDRFFDKVMMGMEKYPPRNDDFQLMVSASKENTHGSVEHIALSSQSSKKNGIITPLGTPVANDVPGHSNVLLVSSFDINHKL